MNTESHIPKAGQAGTDEVEITPEMIEAGCRAAAGYIDAYEEAPIMEGMVSAVFAAMTEVQRGAVSPVR